MDWIERWFSISPDNGDGSLEVLVFVVLFVIAAVLLASMRPAFRSACREACLAVARWWRRQRA
jgi:hypothetical protein